MCKFLRVCYLCIISEDWSSVLVFFLYPILGEAVSGTVIACCAVLLILAAIALISIEYKNEDGYAGWFRSAVVILGGLTSEWVKAVFKNKQRGSCQVATKSVHLSWFCSGTFQQSCINIKKASGQRGKTRRIRAVLQQRVKECKGVCVCVSVWGMHGHVFAQMVLLIVVLNGAQSGNPPAVSV